ncbi:bifunctional glycogen debranching protein GlgX/4-alpha-glucanotransferase [Propionispora vibrioides]|uniref:4-alpha-glucanotransferase n=1 Tax=Propionispora vibrioides TaxID=112903 RepID=A0A1H8Q257_9FIRM|nr:bifunctional glycogen debranching protein GlgX/4-alpha-glucanotransferase [Propionispora vibrioides]SEO47997.1 4-alpha-glucanotransferase [Propionispora vibrioides]
MPKERELQVKQEWMLHNSHLMEFRNPFGAVACGTKVVIRLAVGNWLEPTRVVLRLWQDKTGERQIDMQLLDESEERRIYQGELTAPENPGLLWYYFIVEEYQRTYYYGNNPRNQGGCGRIYREPPASYQITVYQQGATTPAWLKQSVMYQIFPDRFYNGKDGQVSGAPANSMIHTDWNNVPYYVRDCDTKEIMYYDFFGGNLQGIIKKLPYLQELGIDVVYLNPIFKSASNHRYDTGDYHQIDPMLGDEAVFEELCREAKKRGISFILDGVFSHTGSDSLYFNKEGRYPGTGAYQSPQSPYYSWYRFTEYPEKYEAWWGIDTLPNVREMEPTYVDFIIEGEDSVVKHWLKKGARGWRLDVADELPDTFIKKLRTHLKQVDPDNVLIGEVWEDASLKTAYSELRQYLWGDELDSVMNYPFRKILLDFVLGLKDAEETHSALLSLCENYPKENFYALMNLIGSHDVPRIITLLGEAPPGDTISVGKQARFRLDSEKRQLALARLKLLSLWQMTFPGVPAVYYGDEAGLEGYRDPYNRGTYPWGREDQALLTWYKKIIALRKAHPVFSTGTWELLYAGGDIYGYIRRIENGRDVFGAAEPDAAALVLFNRNPRRTIPVTLDRLDNLYGTFTSLLQDYEPITVCEGKLNVVLKPLEAQVWLRREESAFPRESGVLLHPTSLPSPYGVGDLGKEAYLFVDFLAAARQKLWQVFPLNPVGFGESPYQCLSAFAGNKLLISPEFLAQEGWLLSEELESYKLPVTDQVDFANVKVSKEKLLSQAFYRFSQQRPQQTYRNFIRENSSWLEDYALFMALKDHFEQKAWNEWEPDIALREPAALERYRKLLKEQIDYHLFLQYVFYQQWDGLKRYANERGIRIIGDIPIFVAYDSADVWANRHLFKLDASCRPVTIAGVPPDRFTADGQLWGNPHYDWARMELDDYAWWRDRFSVLAKQVDRIRIDHFLGFENYYQISYGELTAANGKWVKGPGVGFFQTIKRYLGTLPIIAEDLGVITKAVEDLKHACGFPGMKVLQFSFYRDKTGPCMPPVFEQNAAIYTGTHDNDTSVGWYQQALSEEPEMIQFMLTCLDLPEGTDSETFCWRFIEYAYQSNANTAIIPMQDLLCLDSRGRMNRPGTLGGNWQWRCRKEAWTSLLAERLATLVERCRR